MTEGEPILYMTEDGNVDGTVVEKLGTNHHETFDAARRKVARLTAEAEDVKKRKVWRVLGKGPGTKK